MIDFNALRARKGQNLEAMQKTLEKTESGSRTKDVRIWKPTIAANGKSENIIRLLPIPYVDMQKVEEGLFQEDQLTPMAKIMRNAFQGPKGWFIENSLLTFAEECPVKEWSMPQWAPLKGKDEKDPSVIAEKDRLKKFIAKKDYYANIQVIKDGTNPANNGKVMIYQLGESVREIIEKAGAPEFETQVAFDPFDLWAGADLYLNLTYEEKKFNGKMNKVPKFDAVSWGPIGPACKGDDTEIESIWKQEHSLLEFYDRKNFKSFDELQKKLQKVLGLDENFNPTGPGSTLGSSAEKFLQNTQSAPAKSAPAASTATNLASSATPDKVVEKAAPVADSSGLSDLDQFEAMLNGS